MELEHCDKYPHPQGRAVSQRKAKQTSEGFFPAIVKDRTTKCTVLNTRVVGNKHKMKYYNFINKIAFFTTSLVFFIICLYRLQLFRERLSEKKKHQSVGDKTERCLGNQWNFAYWPKGNLQVCFFARGKFVFPLRGLYL